MMNLLLKRNQRRSPLGSIEYVLNVELICDARALDIIAEHRLQHQSLFAVPEIQNNQQRAQNAFERSDNRSLFDAGDAFKMIIYNIAGILHTTRAHLSYNVTVADAINGTTITCPDIYELLEAEQEFQDSFDELYRSLQNALVCKAKSCRQYSMTI